MRNFEISKNRFRFVYMIGFVFLWTSNLFSQESKFELAPLFQDNMVLQQRADVTVWGKGNPGSAVDVRTSWGKKADAIVQPDGRWTTKVSTPKAGGPFQMTFRHEKNVTVVRNILIGEVWICSGQSNMEMPLEGWPPSDTIMNSTNEIERALYPAIRLFSVKRSFEAAPVEQCVGNWIECSPVDVRSFSAIAYYFGKSLHTSLNVPIGLINTSWGGTFIEAWMSKEGLKSFQEFVEPLKKLDENRDTLKLLAQWVIKHPVINLSDRDQLHKWEDLKFDDNNCAAVNYNDSTWQEMLLPTSWEQTSLGEFDGVVWFRKQVVIPSAWVGKELTIQLGPIDDMDETYVNSQKVGGYLGEGFWKVPREYKVAGSIVKDSVIQIAVRVIDIQGGGGLFGNGIKLMVYAGDINAGVPLKGAWKYLPVAEYQANKFFVFGAKGNEFQNRPKLPFNFSQNTPASLFNGMVNPLVPFTIKGAIWYQGENNVSDPGFYKKLFPAMIEDWRQKFSCGDFPFYFVQISPYNYGPQSYSQILREAQMQTLSVKNTGMAVIMDIGNPNNIHPANKEDAGKRLALWALAKTYKKNVPFSGPLYKSMKTVKNKIILSFDHAGSGLILKEQNGELYFMIAGQDKVFKKAVVKIQGKTLVVSHPEISNPVSVRYAWSNTEEGTLFNREGLPASSFRTDGWQE